MSKAKELLSLFEREESSLRKDVDKLVSFLKSKKAKNIDEDSLELKRDDGFAIVSWMDSNGNENQVSFWRDESVDPYAILTKAGVSGERDTNFKDFKKLLKEVAKWI